MITPSGQAGSIGVYMMHMDESEALQKEGLKVTLIKAGKYKAEGVGSEPLSDEARAAFQSKVDDYYSMFVKAVAQNRGSSQSKVREGYGQGRMLLASDSVKENLTDRIGTFDEVLGKLGVGGKGSSQTSASTSPEMPKTEEIVPKADDEMADDNTHCENKGAAKSEEDPSWKLKLDARRRALQLH